MLIVVSVCCCCGGTGSGCKVGVPGAAASYLAGVGGIGIAGIAIIAGRGSSEACMSSSVAWAGGSGQFHPWSNAPRSPLEPP